MKRYEVEFCVEVETVKGLSFDGPCPLSPMYFYLFSLSTAMRYKTLRGFPTFEKACHPF